MTATRLLVLGVIRFAQPVHGYDVRRELMSWHIEEHTHVKPGSIYSAMNTLARDGLIREVDRASAGARPERIRYEMTAEGEKEFQGLLRRTLWTVVPANEPLVPGLSMFPLMPRTELIAAMTSRIDTLRGQDKQLAFLESTIRIGATGADGDIPDHAREIIHYLRARLRADLDYSQAFRRRLKRGDYVMAGEQGPNEGSPGDAPPGR
ncbi:PadR family transcriptional regulator [Jatrophihabitans telluris]|uniref:PadR family transcriptional regulator n=1 Tax=Jatrophihabitans telluris TaxID=2038343 RepID=A0ABY4R0T7_9ACTN|nr:PadR family transcriptional regulator [Jatrophihabitans telluris]UQX89390.1 PadR family transcriptional regulator [Jatrophihabitans telluris]